MPVEKLKFLFWRVASFMAVLVLIQACNSDDDDGPEPGPVEADAFLVYYVEGSLKRGEVGTIPGGSVRSELELSMPDQSAPLTAVSISPGAEVVAAATFDNSDSDARNWTGTLVFFDFQTGEIITEQDKEGLTEVLNFPNADAAMQIMAMGWQNDSVLVAHVRPRTDFLPVSSANISLVYSLSTGQALQLSQSGSSEPFALPIPENDEKTLYESSLEGGVIFVDGQAVGGISGVERYDITFRLD